MSLYARIYVETRNVAPGGGYVTHEVTSFQPAQIHNNDPEDSSSDPGYCVETLCGDQLLVTAIHTRWPDGRQCQECVDLIDLEIEDRRRRERVYGEGKA